VATLQSALDEARQDQDLGYKTRFVLAMMAAAVPSDQWNRRAGVGDFGN